VIGWGDLHVWVCLILDDDEVVIRSGAVSVSR
jgi:hypothetical protein